jgi:ADP-dependent phosphofructokinase/glucokinase
MKFTCCVAPSIYSKNPKKTAGLGDNISSMGLIYHKVK